jgi:hypothetical protein
MLRKLRVTRLQIKPFYLAISFPKIYYMGYIPTYRMVCVRMFVTSLFVTTKELNDQNMGIWGICWNYDLSLWWNVLILKDFQFRG